MATLRENRQLIFCVTSAVLLVAGGIAWLSGAVTLSTALWSVDAVLGLAVSLVAVGAAARRRQPTVDVIALLALAGALLIGEAFAAAMITVMLASGQLLEALAAGRARRDLSLLTARAPRVAHRRDADSVADVALAAVEVGDRLVVGAGEVVPVDGRLAAAGVFDESALSGEPLPVEREAGEEVRSGVVNAGSPVEIVATTTAQESTYAAVVRLVEEAEADVAPFVRTADRFALAFVPLTLALAGLSWLVSGSSVLPVAVLVVATPCPLLLAAPIAIMSGLSQAARCGVIVKGGTALERLAGGRVVLFDKTGTLTRGRPTLARISVAPTVSDVDDVLRLAASLDQLSPHPLASAIVTAADARGLALVLPERVEEAHGYGLEGTVSGRRVRIGKAGYVFVGAVPDWAGVALRRAEVDATLTVFVAVDGAPVGALSFDDPIRPDAARIVRALRRAGITRVVLVTGDRGDVADAVGRIVGIDDVRAERDPAGKLAVIAEESAHASTVMVGDGINDAPALAAAGVGVALAARGATASSEAADVVLTVDRLDALAFALRIARRAQRIAREAVTVGMGLSLVAMIVAAVGYLPPAAGAVVQEGIDVLAILIALRALTPPSDGPVALPAADLAVAARLEAEHQSLLPVIDRIAAVADSLDTARPDLAPARELVTRLTSELLPHERADQSELVPLVASALGGGDATAAITRTHAEIEQQILRLERLVADAAEPCTAQDIVAVRRALYTLDTLVRLHNDFEQEGASAVTPIATLRR